MVRKGRLCGQNRETRGDSVFVARSEAAPGQNAAVNLVSISFLSIHYSLSIFMSPQVSNDLATHRGVCVVHCLHSQNAFRNRSVACGVPLSSVGAVCDTGISKTSIDAVPPRRRAYLAPDGLCNGWGEKQPLVLKPHGAFLHSLRAARPHRAKTPRPIYYQYAYSPIIIHNQYASTGV